MINVKQNGEFYTIKFKYDYELIELIKTIPGRVWRKDERVWVIPKNKLGRLIKAVKHTKYAELLCIESDEYLNQNAEIESTSIEDIKNIDISDMKQYVRDGCRLYSHQIDFLKYSKSRLGKGFILADEMGCGKTLEVTNYALYERDIQKSKRCLIICCVNSAKFSWQDDIDTHTNGMEIPYILGTRKKKNGSIKYGTNADKFKDLESCSMYGEKDGVTLPYFIILNIEAIRYKVGKHYPIAEQIARMVNAGEIKIIAIDEVHKNMSPTSTQGKLILTIKKNTEKNCEWIPITGTPITNKPTDVFTPLKLVDGHNFKSYYTWCQNFCVYGGYGGHEILGYKNIPRLKQMLQSHMIRRLKQDVLDLPEKIYYTEYVENTKYQNGLYGEILDELEENKYEILEYMNPLTAMLRLRQVNGSPELVDETLIIDKNYLHVNAKLVRLLELVSEITERNEKVVIFSNWVDPLRVIYRFLRIKHKVCCFTGTMSEQDRYTQKQLFINNPEYKVMIGTIGALGTNHTLTVANNVIFYDEPWNTATKVQCEDRCHRISASKPVNIYTLITKSTIDEYVHKIISNKKGISDFIVDNELNFKDNPDLFDILLGHEKT